MKKLKPITNDDILEFLKQAELVRQSKYLNATSKSKVKIGYKEGRPLEVS